MNIEKLKNTDQMFALLTKNGAITIDDKEKDAIVQEINNAIWFAQTCYAGKEITVPRISKAKRKINKHINELLTYLDTGTPSRGRGLDVKAFHQAISFSNEDREYFCQLSCTLIQLKYELSDFYNTNTDYKNASGKGAKKDDFDILINCLLKIYKRFQGKIHISVRNDGKYSKKHTQVQREDRIIEGNMVKFILSVCSDLTFHGRTKRELENKIKNCYNSYPKN